MISVPSLATYINLDVLIIHTFFSSDLSMPLNFELLSSHVGLGKESGSSCCGQITVWYVAKVVWLQGTSGHASVKYNGGSDEIVHVAWLLR